MRLDCDPHLARAWVPCDYGVGRATCRDHRDDIWLPAAETKYRRRLRSSVTRVTEENVGAFIQGALDAPEADALGDRMESAFGVTPSARERRVINALVAMRLGLTPGTVTRHLGWKDFESFCAMVFRSRGFEVKENLTLTKPRAQIDLVAVGPSYVVCVDCKRWKRDHSPSVLKRFASAQKRRSSLLRKVVGEPKPILSAIISVSAARGDFVDGVAIIPIGALTGFLDSAEAYLDRFEAS